MGEHEEEGRGQTHVLYLFIQFLRKESEKDETKIRKLIVEHKRNQTNTKTFSI